MNPRLVLGLALIGFLLLSGCRGRARDAEEAFQFTEEELWKQAQDYLAREKHRKAAQYLKLLLDQYPTGGRARDAQLAYADTLFELGSDPNLIEAQAKYLAFVAFYPEDPRTDYAQFRLALCNFERRGKPNRDLSVTRAAIDEFQKVIQEYPDSEYQDEARVKISELRDELAEHEYGVAHFYKRRGFRESAVKRIKFLLEKYPAYSRKDEAYMLMIEVLMKLENYEEAAMWLERMIAEYPGSEERKDAEKLLERAQREIAKQESRGERTEEADDAAGDVE